MNKRFGSFKFELLFIFLLFVLSRLPSLGHDTFNTDVWKWKARTYDFGSGVFNLNFAQTIQKYHPGVTLMWIGTTAVKVYNLYYESLLKTTPPDNSVKTVFELNFVQKLFIVFVISAVLTSIYYVLSNLFGRKYAFIWYLLAILEPFFTALSREIHLEGLLTVFMLASFIWFYYYLEDHTKSSRLIISGVFCGLSVLTKTTGVFLVPFIGLIVFLSYFNRKDSFLTVFKLALTPFYKWLLVSVVSFILIWPAMWVVPVEALRTLYKGIFTVGIEGGHEQLYFGQVFEDPGISFYLVVFILKSSLYLLVGLFGYLLFAKKAFSRNTHRFVFFVFLFALFYFVEITIPTKKLDRYVLPSLFSLLMIAAFFYEWLLTKAKNFYFFALLWLFAPAIILFVKLVPDYFSYYSPVTGGLEKGIQILEPKWMIGQKEISSYFQNLKNSEGLVSFGDTESLEKYLNTKEIDSKLTVGFQEKYYTQIWPFINDIGGRAVIKDLTPQAVKTKFFVYPVWEDESTTEDRFKLIYVGSIKIDNAEVYRVYRRI